MSCVVALKETFVGSSAQLREAFQREAALLANLRHPALPKVMDYFGEGDGEFLVMEFITGVDLLELVNSRGALPQLQVLNWSIELLKLLEYLHTHEPPILHRDLKPSNLKVTQGGELFLLDFFHNVHHRSTRPSEKMLNGPQTRETFEATIATLLNDHP